MSGTIDKYAPGIALAAAVLISAGCENAAEELLKQTGHTPEKLKANGAYINDVNVIELWLDSQKYGVKQEQADHNLTT